MPKYIDSIDSQQYRKQLAEFMQTINPKPTLEVVEKLRQQYLEKRITASK